MWYPIKAVRRIQTGPILTLVTGLIIQNAQKYNGFNLNVNQCVSSLLSRGLKSISSAWAWSLADGRYRYWDASSPSRFSPVRSPAKLPHRAVRSGSHTNAFLLKVRGHYKDNLPASNYRETRTNNHWAYEPLFKESYWRDDQLHSRVEKPPPSPLPLWEQNLWPSKFWRVFGYLEVYCECFLQRFCHFFF